MGLFDWFGGKKNNEEPSWEERNAYTGETPPCPRCGTPETKSQGLFHQIHKKQGRKSIPDSRPSLFIYRQLTSAALRFSTYA